MLEKAILVTLGAMCLFASGTASAVSHATNIASETTQLLNMAELVEQSTRLLKQLKKTKEQLRIMQTDAKSLVGDRWKDAINAVREVEQIYNEGRAIAYAARQITGRYDEMYPSYRSLSIKGVTVRDVSDYYDKWDRLTRKAVIMRAKAAGAISRGFREDADIMKEIQQKGLDADGRNQILQATVVATTTVGNQILQLRQQLLTQQEMEAELRARDMAERSMKRVASERVLAVPKLNARAKNLKKF